MSSLKKAAFAMPSSISLLIVFSLSSIYYSITSSGGFSHPRIVIIGKLGSDPAFSKFSTISSQNPIMAQCSTVPGLPNLFDNSV
jgi:hypothetical protein